MKTLASTFALAVILTTCGADSARAQSIGSISDFMNDYELYVTQNQTSWYTVVTWDDGTVSEYRSVSEESAEDWALWLYLHVIEVRDIDIVSRYELGEWIYVDTFGTYSAAADEASDWEADGFETDIRSIRVNEFTAIPYQPITTRSISKSTSLLKK